jgi:hypothetical protein
MDAFDRKGIEPIEWCAKSPDLNPLENLWAIIKNKLGKQTITTQDQLV